MEKYGALLINDSIVCIHGKINVREGQGTSLLIDEVEPLSQVRQRSRLYLRVDEKTEHMLPAVYDMIRRYKGNSEVVVRNEVTKKTSLAPKSMCVNASEALLRDLKEMLGEESVRLVTNNA